MPANIFGNRVALHDQPAWHTLGMVFTGNISASEAVEKADLAYAIVSCPTFGAFPNTSGGTDLVQVEDRFTIMREPTHDDPQPRPLGIVGSHYEVLQNMQIAQALDLLTENWPVETAGALGHGEITFFALQAGEISVGGRDPVKMYFLVRDQKDGTKKIRIGLTPVRVVCQNTLSMALDGMEISISLAHVRGVGVSLLNKVEIIEQFQRKQADVESLFGNMATTKVTGEEIQHLLDTLYPLPQKPEDKSAERAFERALAKVQDVRGQYNKLFGTFNQEQGWAANTQWSAYNAAVELEDYRKGKNREVSLLWGPRADVKKMAFATLVSKD